MQLTRHWPPMLLLAAAALLAGCQSDDAKPVEQQHIFGNGARDPSRILARVNGYDITENMLEMRLEELHRAEKTRYETPEGRRLFLRHMVDEALQVQDALARKLHLDPLVARVLIAERRGTLILAQHADLMRNREPDIDAVRDFFARNRDDYRLMGIMRASHVECLTREDAEEVYRLLALENASLDPVVKQYSQNEATRSRGGSLGNFNPGGFIDGIDESRVFTQKVWELEDKVNLPVEHEGRWHVIVIHERTPERRQTLEEAYQRVLIDMQQDFQGALIDQWLQESRKTASVEFFGEYRPGQGASPQELMERAFYLRDPRQQQDLLQLLVDDYPDSELADKALLMAASIAIDQQDLYTARSYLLRLLNLYPDSEVADDATYFLENLHKPDFRQPRTIEDLRPRR